MRTLYTKAPRSKGHGLLQGLIPSLRLEKKECLWEWRNKTREKVELSHGTPVCLPQGFGDLLGIQSMIDLCLQRPPNQMHPQPKKKQAMCLSDLSQGFSR